jgi:predicted DNA-binding helix-hairpin-helix protein
MGEHHLSLQQRVKILAEATKYDSCNQTAVCHTFTPDGRCIQLYKTLLSNNCIGECLYCPNQQGRSTTRASLTPEEIVKITLHFYQKNATEGLFLSSGIIGDPEKTSEKQLEVARLLRERGFNGYIHLRLMPGVPRHLLEEISLYANKFGVNSEVTCKTNYQELCPNFDYQKDVLLRMKWTCELIERRRWDAREKYEYRIIGANDTQFVVGAIEETDYQILKTVERFMKRYRLRRPYFMSFEPVAGTPLEKQPPSPLWREHRLYQSAYLLKDYPLRAEDFREVLDEEGNLLNSDPKMLLAEAREELYPLDVNTASFEELLLVPGIGPASASRIVNTRPLKDERELVRLGVVITRARGYITLKGQRQTLLKAYT